ncbi:hypothetical protein F5Y14DRAFT_410352 [Nemania sp. NC0429]|nr:hypothetical protein F5Y14DRAFT_410352 [Nemania sp. NC0429]
MEVQETTRHTDAVDGRDAERNSRCSDVTTATDEKSIRSSCSHWGPGPGFEEIDGVVGGRSYNETTVDIIAVPCIGASPIDTWARDPLSDGYFTNPPTNEHDNYSTVKALPGSTALSPAITHTLPKASHSWIRQGIRGEANQARIMLYRHREVTEGMTIESAADDLIEQVMKMRAGLKKSRPIFFICHSIGGLVVKSALVKAKTVDALRPLMYYCHGITFFGTPHHGSSYLSMPNLRDSIQQLLFLEKQLPRSITDRLRLGYKPLLKLHDSFTDIAGELRLWTFYETVDSQLSGFGSGEFDEVHFSAPITSIKSGLIGARTEQALSLESDHAHCASFGPQNLQIMHSYLYDLGEAVRKAETLSANFVHTPLRLESKVKVELIGFYDDPDSGEDRSVRLYVSKHFLNEFLEKGPEDCLRERMHTMAPKMRRARVYSSRRPAASPSRMSRAANILSNVQEFGQRILGSSPMGSRAQSPERDPTSPEIVVTSHTRRPSLAGATSDPLPNVNVSSGRSRGLVLPDFTTPSSTQPPVHGGTESLRSSIDGIVRALSEPSALGVSPMTRESHHNHSGSQTTGDGAQSEEEGNNSSRGSHGGLMGRASTMQEFTAGFSRPDPSKRKFMWIHLPFNNPYWVKGIFDKLSESQNRSYSKLLNNDYWASKHVQGRRSNWHVSYVKPGCAFVPAETSVPRSPSPGKSGRSVSPSKTPSHFYLYLPYLHYDTYINVLRRRNILKLRMKHGRARPVPQEIAELESLESRVIWQFIGSDQPLNARRTLDQYGYPALQDTWARDDDQMLYKLTKQTVTDPMKRMRDMYHSGKDQPSAVSPDSRMTSPAERLLKGDDINGNGAEGPEPTLEEDIINGNVLMVDQLWLWAVDNTTLMTFFPKRESHPIEGPLFKQADLRNSIYNELNGDLTGRCENALDLAAFITLHAVTVLLDRSSHPDLEIFRIFEEAIGVLTERMTSSLKEFRMQSHTKMNDDSDSDDPDDNSTETIKKRHKRELERAERQNRENTSAVLELRDMEDELHTLLNLFTEQQDTIKAMKASSEKSEGQTFTEFGREYLKEALRRLEEYDKQVHDMLIRVDGTRKDYEKLQEMIQRQAQVDEVRWSRLQAELATSQNLSVMIFTTFTVIFLPLSFFTSLFGMNTQEWGGPDANNFLSLKLIGAISLPASAFVITLTLIAAFSGRMQSLIKMTYRASQAILELCARPPRAFIQGVLARLEPAEESGSSANKNKNKKNKKSRRARKLEERRLRRQKRDGGYDFWARVRAERRDEYDYEIPETNRKSAFLRSKLVGRGTWSRLVGEER